MAKEFKRLVFHKGSCDKKIPGPKLDRDFLNFQNVSNWPSSLMVSLKEYFDEIIYLISVPNRRDARSPVIEHGIKYEVVYKEDLTSKWMHDCDVFFNRAATIVPPENPVSIYYSASSDVVPKGSSKWDAVLTTPVFPDRTCTKINNNIYSWIKGENSDFWRSEYIEKEFDFVVVGRRGKDIKCVIELAKKYPQMKIVSVGWGGKYNIEKRKFEMPEKPVFNRPNITELGRLLDHGKVRDVLNRSKIGIAVAAIWDGFPMQTQMEYSMTGLYFVYDRFMLQDGYYVNNTTASIFSDSGKVLKNWQELGRCAREYAIKNFSSEVSASCFMKIISSVRKK